MSVLNLLVVKMEPRKNQRDEGANDNMTEKKIAKNVVTSSISLRVPSEKGATSHLRSLNYPFLRPCFR